MGLSTPSRRAWLSLAGGTGASWLLGACAPLGTTASSSSPPARPQRPIGTALPASSGLGLEGRIDRLTWGVNDTTAQAVAALGWDAWLEQQLQARPAALPASLQAQVDGMTIVREPMESLVPRIETQRRATDAIANDDTKKSARQAYQQEMSRLARESASRHVLRALHSPSQVHEQMTWFWLNHFNVHQFKANLRAMVGDYEERAIRPHALGRFRDLLGAVTLHPAMLRYLDNEQNAQGRLNENHARELMELHTLGVDGGYTQEDVQELARVLTGVGVNFGGRPAAAIRRELQAWHVQRGAFEFNPNRHDFGPKRLLGQPLSARGLPEVDEALDRLARHPSTARFISRKLARFWLSDEPPTDVVEAMARSFRDSDGRIATVLRTLFDAPIFWQARKFKDPMRFVMSALRQAYDERPILNTGPVLFWLNRLGEPLYGRQTPDGYPLDARAWDSAGQMAMRFEIARTLASGSAGLFRVEGPAAREEPAFPRLSTPVFFQWRAATLGPASHAALAQATSPQEWGTFLLSSPEFMQR